MKRLVFIGIMAITLVKYAGAQEQLSIRQQADKLFERYEYFKSVTLYLKLVKKGKTDVKVLERIADCYFNMNRYEDAEPWYARAVADTKASRLSHYNYAEVLLRNQKLDTAKQQYRVYYANDAAGLKQKLAVCDSAALWMTQPSGWKIKNEATFNTEYSDWGLTYDGKTSVIFTSDRKTGDEDIDERTGNNWFKLYEEAINNAEVKELFPSDNGSGIFNDGYHIGPVALNSSADTAYITITTGISKKKLAVDDKAKQRLYTRRLQLVMASKQNGQWVVFGSFPYNDVQKYSVGDAALSKDGRILYFASDMPGGEGKTDIWYCEKAADGTWGRPVNCGKRINTNEEEAFPTISGDGALYYSSKGLPGMGGYDIYRAKGEKAQWNAPENLKYPVNSTSDDFCLVTRDGLTGYFSSNRQGGQGSDDIYSYTVTPIHTNPIKRTARADTPGIKPATPVKPIETFGLTTIYYDLDKSNIRPDAAIELDKLIIILKQHPELKIELSSFTDSRASEAYNMALSQRRVNSAAAYLTNKGISETRLIKGYYGKTHLVNQCADGVECTEAEHQWNRRTEIAVLK
jgi:outer membrane protein OmpA-like peptidoglycan-associated protein